MRIKKFNKFRFKIRLNHNKGLNQIRKRRRKIWKEGGRDENVVDGGGEGGAKE